MGGYNIDTNILVAITAGLGGMVLWGLADFFVKKIVSEVNDAIVLFWTQTIGIIPLILYLLIYPRVHLFLNLHIFALLQQL